jgi:hypothetical protein
VYLSLLDDDPVEQFLPQRLLHSPGPETITYVRLGKDIVRLVRIWLDLFAQPADKNPQIGRLVIALVPPYPGQELLMCENTTSVRGQVIEEFVLCGG